MASLNLSSTDLIRRKKRSSAESSPRTAAFDGKCHLPWRSEKRQRIYSAKLIKALQQLRHNSLAATSSSPTAQKGGKIVRDAADRALAVSARGRTLWSRAILAKRIKLKSRKHKRRTQTTAIPSLIMNSNRIRSKKQRVSVLKLNKKSKPAIHRKIRLLGQLIPGCEKQSVPVILEEATDYIQALEMQIRAMNSLAQLLSSSSPPSPL